MTVPILILAGGASARMGSRHKLLEEVQGQPLLRLQVWRALKASREVTVLLRPGQPQLRRALAGLQVRILTPSEALEGMGGSIRAGTRAHLRSRCFVLMLADLVDIEAGDLRSLIARRSSENGPVIWRGATEDGRPGHPILFENAVFGDLLNCRGDVGAQAVLDAHADGVRLVPLTGNHAVTDLDSPEDWAAWRASQPREDAPADQ